MNRLIEDYLRTRGVRFFRGHHDDEYFYLVGVGAHRGHLNVHLEVCGPDRDAVQIGITADRYYPAGVRDGLADLAARWNAGSPTVPAVVHDSSDPRLVGLSAGGVFRPAGIADLSAFVDTAVSGAVTLFGDATRLAAPAALRDAG